MNNAHAIGLQQAVERLQRQVPTLGTVTYFWYHIDGELFVVLINGEWSTCASYARAIEDLHDRAQVLILADDN